MLLNQMCSAVIELVEKDDLRSLWRKFRFDADDIYALEMDYRGKTMLRQRAAATMNLWSFSVTMLISVASR